MHKITLRAIELWDEYPADRLGQPQEKIGVDGQLAREFNTTPSKVAGYSNQAIQFIWRARAKRQHGEPNPDAPLPARHREKLCLTCNKIIVVYCNKRACPECFDTLIAGRADVLRDERFKQTVRARRQAESIAATREYTVFNKTASWSDHYAADNPGYSEDGAIPIAAVLPDGTRVDIDLQAQLEAEFAVMDTLPPGKPIPIHEQISFLYHGSGDNPSRPHGRSWTKLELWATPGTVYKFGHYCRECGDKFPGYHDTYAWSALCDKCQAVRAPGYE